LKKDGFPQRAKNWPKTLEPMPPLTEDSKKKKPKAGEEKIPAQR